MASKGLENDGKDGGSLTLTTTNRNVRSGTTLGVIEFKAPKSSTVWGLRQSKVVGASIEAVAKSSFGSTSHPAELVFKTGTTTGTKQHMVLSSDGYLGIGSTTPTAPLQIEAANPIIAMKATASGGDSQIQFKNSSGTTLGTIKCNSSVSGFDYLSINHNGNENDIAINSLGNVGIGTATPISKFSVAGMISITSEASTPAQPADGNGYLYSKAGGKLYWRSHDLTETDLTSGLTINNVAENRLVTIASNTAQLDAESTLTFDGNKLSVGGGLVLNRRVVSATTTVAANDYFLALAVTSSVTLNLPNASTLSNGQTFVIKDESDNLSASIVVTLTPVNGQTIDGEATLSINKPGAAINVYTDGSTKYFIY
jgi:hypothetical protein